MKEIFISYSTVDITSAETVRDILEQNGLSCWMAPRDIPGGSNYTKEIPIAIRNCKVFVLILSNSSQSSQWVLKELDSAVNAGKVILPFMLEDCILNDEFNFLLTGTQRYSAYQKKAEALETLIGRIRGILNVNVATDNTADAGDEINLQIPAKKPEAPKTSSVDIPKCTACGSIDAKETPRRTLRHGAKEILSMLLIPLFGFVGMGAALTICTFALPYEQLGLLGVFLILGFALGAFVGDGISKTMVRRSRIRRRINTKCYRCNACKKRFRHETPINN